MIKKNTHIHFMGIGGIGMSGIAKILKCQGYMISGCDTDIEQPTIKELINLGCKITCEHNNKLVCQDLTIDTLVYSTAIKQTNPEILSAKEKGINIIHRSTMLANLMKEKKSIAIAGSHGKTTTTSMVSHVLIESNIDPTVIIGGHMKNISTNAQLGKSEFFVIEADESDRSIIKLNPTWGIITNIDLEHLETYKDLDDIKNTFKQFINNISSNGKAIVCIDDEQIRSILPLNNVKTITYGIEHKADLSANNIQIYSTYSTFDVWQKDKNLGTVELNMPGKHNILNCLATIAVCLDLQINFDSISYSLKNFKGIERRFSYNGSFNEIEIFDDYGHHPIEIKNTLEIAKKRAKNNLSVVFQPHRYTRTAKLWDQFIEVFTNSPINNLIITDIYPASENPISNITSFNLVNSIKQKRPDLNILYCSLDDDFTEIINKLNYLLHKDDLLLLLGAGKVNKIALKLIIK